MSYIALVRRAERLNVELQLYNPIVPESHVFKTTGFAGMLYIPGQRPLKVLDTKTLKNAPDGSEFVSTDVVTPNKTYVIEIGTRVDGGWVRVLRQAYNDAVLVSEYSLNRHVTAVAKAQAATAAAKQKKWRPFAALRAMLGGSK